MAKKAKNKDNGFAINHNIYKDNTKRNTILGTIFAFILIFALCYLAYFLGTKQKEADIKEKITVAQTQGRKQALDKYRPEGEAYKEIYNKGFASGRKKGKTEGREKGLAQGRKEGKIEGQKLIITGLKDEVSANLQTTSPSSLGRKYSLEELLELNSAFMGNENIEVGTPYLVLIGSGADYNFIAEKTALSKSYLYKLCEDADNRVCRVNMPAVQEDNKEG